jgi:hypothetical protein
MKNRESLASSGVDAAKIRGPNAMLPTPSPSEIEGLSARDLTVCLMCLPHAKDRPRFYQDRLLSEWFDIDKLTRRKAAERWAALPKATRNWFVRRIRAGAAVGLRTSPHAVGKAVRNIRKSLALKGQRDPEAQGLHRRGTHRYARNVLFWNWRHAGLFSEISWATELAHFYLSLPAEVRHAIEGHKADRSARQLIQDITHAVRWCDRHLDAATRRRYGPPGFSATAAAAAAGSLRQRRAVWLSWFEAEGTPTFHNKQAIVEKWDALSDAERLAIGGARGWQRLRDRQHYAHLAKQYVHQEILRALWERQIQGKPIGYGQDLFFLVDHARGLKPAQSAEHWGGIGDARQRRFSPGGLPFSRQLFTVPPGEIVAAAVRRIRPDKSAMAFAESYAKLIGTFGPARSGRPKSGKIEQAKALLAQTEARLSSQQIADQVGLAAGTVRRIRRGGDSKPPWPAWYAKVAALSEEKGLRGAKLLDYIWDVLSEAERRDLIPEDRWTSYLPHRGRRVASQLRLRAIVSAGKRMLHPRKAGRKRKCQALLALHDEMKLADPTVRLKDVVKRYKADNAAAIEAGDVPDATPKTLKDALRNRRLRLHCGSPIRPGRKICAG